MESFGAEGSSRENNLPESGNCRLPGSAKAGQRSARINNQNTSAAYRMEQLSFVVLTNGVKKMFVPDVTSLEPGKLSVKGQTVSYG